MIRYIAIAYDHHEPHQVSAFRTVLGRIRAGRTRWRSVVDCQGLFIACADERPDVTECHPLDTGLGVVVGTLFRRVDVLEPPKVNSAATLIGDSAEIIKTGGQRLVTHYWGAYVAFLRNPTINGVSILRSPAGRLPCLQTAYRGVSIFFSYMPDCWSLGIIDFSINWQFVAGFLARVAHTGRTGLNEVREIQCGERVEIHSGGSTRTLLWHADDYVRPEPEGDVTRAAELLRRTTTGCVHSWASQHSRILHNLSGGLDSSIVLGCLRDAPTKPAITAVCHYSPGSDSDERKFAQLAANRAGVDLIEHRRSPEVDLQRALGAEVAERPLGYSRRIDAGGIAIRLARELSATAIFSGNRGDEIFFRNFLPLTVADYVFCKGVRPGLFKLALSVARSDGLSVWKVLREGLANGLGDYRLNAVTFSRSYNTLVNTEAVNSLLHDGTDSSPQHPYDADIPPGKQYHAFSLRVPEPYYQPFCEADWADELAPLMSQPLIELVLGIPSWLLSHDGWDRMLARQAFVGVVPTEILRRRSKGGMEEHAAYLLRRNIRFIREVLLNGELVKRGLLNRAKLEEALSDHPSNAMKGMVKIFQHLDVELWLQIWSASRTRLAA